MNAKRKTNLVLVVLIPTFIIVGVLRYLQSLPKKYNFDEIVAISGTVSDEPRISNNSMSFHVDGQKVLAHPLDGVEYGDIVTIEGSITKTGSLKAFTIERREQDPLFFVPRFFGAIRKELQDIPAMYLPSREAGLVVGATLGVKQGDRTFINALRKTGTLHILVVSGANLSMVANFLLSLKPRIGKKKTLILSIGVVWVYALLTGMQAPVVRAAIMVSFTFAAQLLGKQAWNLYILILTALIMLFFNPLLINDISFQLSFAATLGIVLFANTFSIALNEHLRFKYLPFSLGDNLGTTLAAQIIVDPLLAWHFHQISLLSPIVNVLVLPIVFYVTVVGMALIVFGYFSSTLAYLISLLLLIPTKYFTFVIMQFAQIPFSSIRVLGINGLMLIGYYGLLASVVYYHKQKPIAFFRSSRIRTSDKILLQ